LFGNSEGLNRQVAKCAKEDKCKIGFRLGVLLSLAVF
jgi:hypothetical protein